MINAYSMIQSHIFYLRQSCFQEVVCKFNRTILQNACCSGVYSGRVHMTNGTGRCFDLWKAGKLPGSGPAVLDDVSELFSGGSIVLRSLLTTPNARDIHTTLAWPRPHTHVWFILMQIHMHMHKCGINVELLGICLDLLTISVYSIHCSGFTCI